MKLIRKNGMWTIVLAFVAATATAQNHGGSSGESMKLMDSQMAEMQRGMAAIRAEEDPERRRELMEQHMRDMEGMMGMMRERMREQDKGMHGGGMGMMNGHGGDMEQCMELMGQHSQMKKDMMKHSEKQGAKSEHTEGEHQQHQH